MRPKVFSISLLLVLLYFVLFKLFSSLLLSAAGSGLFTESTAVNTLIYHYLPMLAGAIPIAAILVSWFRSTWLILAATVSILACLGTLTYVLYGFWQLRHMPETFVISRELILFADVVASGAILFGVALLMGKMLSSKDRRD